MNDVVELTTKAEYDEALKSGRAVIDFARRFGCVPCQRLEPHFKLAASAAVLKDTNFYKVMLDEVEPELLNYVLDELHVLSTPTVIEFRNGARYADITGRTAPLIIKELSE